MDRYTIELGHDVRRWTTFTIDLEPYERNDLDRAESEVEAAALLKTWFEAGRLTVADEFTEEDPDPFHPSNSPSVIDIAMEVEG